MRKGLFYICLLLVGVGLFAGCKSKKAVVASFSDLDGEWGVVEMNGKTLNPCLLYTSPSPRDCS